MPLQSDGTWSKRTITGMLQSLIDGLRAQYGADEDVSPNSPDRKLLEAFGALPLGELENDKDDLYSQMFFESALGDNLDKLLEPFGFSRKAASRATGTVNLTLKAAKSNSDFNPMFAVGDLVFLDARGRKFDMTENAVLGSSATTALSVKVRARDLGAAGNAALNGIVGVQFGNATASTRWSDHVSTSTNNAAFSGGLDKETDRELRDRVRNSLSSKHGCSLDGLVATIQDVAGVAGVTGEENLTDTGGSTDKVFDFNSGGVGITIDGTTTKVSQKLTPSARRFIQHFKLDFTAVTGLTFKARLETDSAGSASGTLVDAVFDKSFTPGGTGEFTGTWDNGKYVPTSSPVHLVIERTAGSGTLDGANSGTADQVKKHDGSWSVPAGGPDNLEAELIGGIPPHGFRLYVQGGVAADIAKAIGGERPAGAPSDGTTSGTWTNRANQTVTEYWEVPSEVPVYITVTVSKDASFTGDATTIKDIIIEYIGGTDSKGKVHKGLGVAKNVVKNEIISRLLDDSIISGTVDVTAINLDRVTPPVGTGNLTAALNERFKIASASDITVTLADV